MEQQHITLVVVEEDTILVEELLVLEALEEEALEQEIV
jgi:hypothetical protein